MLRMEKSLWSSTGLASILEPWEPCHANAPTIVKIYLGVSWSCNSHINTNHNYQNSNFFSTFGGISICIYNYKYIYISIVLYSSTHFYIILYKVWLVKLTSFTVIPWWKPGRSLLGSDHLLVNDYKRLADGHGLDAIWWTPPSRELLTNICV